MGDTKRKLRLKDTSQGYVINYLDRNNRVNLIYYSLLLDMDQENINNFNDVVRSFKKKKDFIGSYMLCEVVQQNDNNILVPVITNGISMLLRRMARGRHNLRFVINCDNMDKLNTGDIWIASISDLGISGINAFVSVKLIKMAYMEYTLDCPGWNLFLGLLRKFSFQYVPFNFDLLNEKMLDNLCGNYQYLEHKYGKLWESYINGEYDFNVINEAASLDISVYALAYDYKFNTLEYEIKFPYLYANLKGYADVSKIADRIMLALAYYKKKAPKSIWNRGYSVLEIAELSSKALSRVQLLSSKYYTEYVEKCKNNWWKANASLETSSELDSKIRKLELELNAYKKAYINKKQSIDEQNRLNIKDRAYSRLNDMEKVAGVVNKGDVLLLKHRFIKADWGTRGGIVSIYGDYNKSVEFICGISISLSATNEFRKALANGSIAEQLNEIGIRNWVSGLKASSNQSVLVIVDDIFNSRYIKLMLLDTGFNSDEFRQLYWMTFSCSTMLRARRCDTLKKAAKEMCKLFDISVNGEMEHVAIEHIYMDKN